MFLPKKNPIWLSNTKWTDTDNTNSLRRVYLFVRYMYIYMNINVCTYICVYNNIHKINQNLVEIKEEYIGEVRERKGK